MAIVRLTVIKSRRGEQVAVNLLNAQSPIIFWAIERERQGTRAMSSKVPIEVYRPATPVEALNEVVELFERELKRTEAHLAHDRHNGGLKATARDREDRLRVLKQIRERGACYLS